MTAASSSSPVSAASSNAVIVARMTPRGRGAVATIRVHGDHTLLDRLAVPMFRPVNGQRLGDQEFGRLVFGSWGYESAENIVICRLDAATLEIHCHGGDLAVERILRDWKGVGAAVVSWNELFAGTVDRLEAELQECLSRTVTWRTAEFVLSQTNGRLRSAYEALVDVQWTPAERERTEASITGLLNWATFGEHLVEPWRVVLTGPPNVGKSSLINALLGYQRSIVFDEPGTTRDVVTAETAFDGWPVQLVDTAGLRAASEALEAEGIARAREQLAQADLVLELIDVSDPGSMVGLRSNDASSLVIAHKCDLPDRCGDLLPPHALRVSSFTGYGIAELQRELVKRLVPDVPPLDAPIPLTRRQTNLLKGALEALSSADESRYRTLAACLIME
jgi:tRNA modification GTPase